MPTPIAYLRLVRSSSDTLLPEFSKTARTPIAAAKSLRRSRAGESHESFHTRTCLRRPLTRRNSLLQLRRVSLTQSSPVSAQALPAHPIIHELRDWHHPKSHGGTVRHSGDDLMNVPAR